MQKPTRRTFSLDVTAEPHPEVREAELNELLYTRNCRVVFFIEHTASRTRVQLEAVARQSSSEKQRGCRRTPTSKDLANRRVHIALFTSPEHKDGTNQRECSTLQTHNLFFFIRIVFVGREWRTLVLPSCSSGGDSSCCLVSPLQRRTSGTLQLTRRSQIVGAEKAPLLDRANRTRRPATHSMLVCPSRCGSRRNNPRRGRHIVQLHFSTRTQCLDFVLISGHGNCVSDPTTRRCVRHETWQFVISDTRHFVFSVLVCLLHIACLISSDEGTLIVSNWNGREREEEKDEREEKSEIMRPVSQFTPLSFISVCSVSVQYLSTTIQSEIKEIEEKSEKNVLSDFIIDLAGNGYDRQKKQSVGRRAVGPTAAHAYVFEHNLRHKGVHSGEIRTSTFSSLLGPKFGTQFDEFSTDFDQDCLDQRPTVSPRF
ncbi:hypothetical protein BLNAU_23365 [Blattamonas nauphoetae]|uniref:Uncharacterized protein n=1 Tax=Blattamonas nauphoetae TaxID=2049346 RepID=A0ABQ9WQF1_9EUKA|nr:hypothetical protein BLNAU_23365 [Blattamonas nauphoetae]